MPNPCSEKFMSAVAGKTVAEGVDQQILGYDPSILMARASFETGSVGAIHSHPHSQVTYVESGEFEVNIDGELQILKAGDAFYVPPDTSHGAVCRQAGALIDVFSPMREDFFESESPYGEPQR